MKATNKLIICIIALSITAITGAGCAYISSQIGKHPDKIWLHRTNSMAKHNEQEKRFPNVEVDVVFRANNAFDVTHDADTTFKQSIEPYFADAGRDKDHIWLDIKNLNSENAQAMLHTLNKLCDEYGVKKQQLIIESRNYRELARFTAADYYTSFYVDFTKPDKLSKSQIDSCITILQQVADSRKVRALSFPGWWYTTLKAQLHRPIDLLTWKHRTTEFELLALPENRKMLHDPQVKVILVKSKGRFHR